MVERATPVCAKSALLVIFSQSVVVVRIWAVRRGDRAQRRKRGKHAYLEPANNGLGGRT